MTIFGKSIRMYLKDGTATGVRFGEIFNQTIMAIACPRNRVTELKSEEAAKKPGVYFLFGNDDKTGGMKVNIGEAENVFSRLQNKLPEKDFCNEIIIFVSKDENLTKAHVKYLESRSIQTANSTMRYLVDNPNDSQASSLPMGDRDAMEEFFIYIKLLLGVFGHKFLEDLNPIAPREETLSTAMEDNQIVVTSGIIKLSLSVSGLKAKSIQSDEGIVVLQGSEATKEITNSLQNGYRDLREKLIADGTLALDNNKYIFLKNFLFDSPSAAAAVIVGHSISGPQTWRDSSGKTLKEIEEQKLRN